MFWGLSCAITFLDGTIIAFYSLHVNDMDSDINPDINPDMKPDMKPDMESSSIHNGFPADT